MRLKCSNFVMCMIVTHVHVHVCCFVWKVIVESSETILSNSLLIVPTGRLCFISL